LVELSTVLASILVNATAKEPKNKDRIGFLHAVYLDIAIVFGNPVQYRPMSAALCFIAFHGT